MPGTTSFFVYHFVYHSRRTKNQLKIDMMYKKHVKQKGTIHSMTFFRKEHFSP